MSLQVYKRLVSVCVGDLIGSFGIDMSAIDDNTLVLRE